MIQSANVPFISSRYNVKAWYSYARKQLGRGMEGYLNEIIIS